VREPSNVVVDDEPTLGIIVTVYKPREKSGVGGGVRVKVALASPAVADKFVGESGNVSISLLGKEGKDVPIAVLVVTIKVYVRPFVSPVIFIVVPEPVVTGELPPTLGSGIAEHVYPDTGYPPLSPGVNVTSTDPFVVFTTAFVIVGGLGGSPGIAVFEFVLKVEVSPKEFVAVI